MTNLFSHFILLYILLGSYYNSGTSFSGCKYGDISRKQEICHFVNEKQKCVALEKNLSIATQTIMLDQSCLCERCFFFNLGIVLFYIEAKHT